MPLEGAKWLSLATISTLGQVPSIFHPLIISNMKTGSIRIFVSPCWDQVHV